EEPEFGIVVENNHTVTCLIDVGTKEQEFVVKKDGDVVWSSKYCAAPKDENAEVSTEFAPQSEKTAKLKWNRIQVDKNCNRTDEDVAPGKYDLIGKLEERASEPTTLERETEARSQRRPRSSGAIGFRWIRTATARMRTSHGGSTISSSNSMIGRANRRLSSWRRTPPPRPRRTRPRRRRTTSAARRTPPTRNPR